ncbi:hypothetical protein [Trueperella bernardiae]|uniref:hypothetical protein n=1 Tax=Trueperella bernardiae TaxID=59561 RepID=UPI002889CAA2|nr:hypothetical protein [Trueperella bernardiae]
MVRPCDVDQSSGDQTAFVCDPVSQTGGKNGILLVGDGMDDQEITAARNYAVSNGNRSPSSPR